MRFVVYVSGLLAIAGFFAVVEVRVRRKKAESELETFAAGVPAPLTPEVREWLRPQLARRYFYPQIGGTVGLTAAHVAMFPEWGELPWYWFEVLIGSMTGAVAGALLAGYRTTPLVDGPRRTVDPVRRRVSDFCSRSRVLRLRLAPVVSGAAFVVALVIATSYDGPTTRRALVTCALGLVLTLAHQWVVTAVVTRPLVASSPDGLAWQRALVAKTVDALPYQAFFIAVFSAAIALFAAAVTIRDLPLPVLLLSAGLAVLTLASVVVVVVAIRDEKQPSPQQESTLP
ncbi:putative membrane protein [Nocardioides salarius]|uniref:Membrane protein n=1 Tax=Nocardioides salarius TaxID=374513 RepID=A0ABS2MB90_9ACTN|nr:hypothetical protein [Nocardioides salarius]MBM7508468.1 putative membrane protein [Nocardioides salarius]